MDSGLLLYDCREAPSARRARMFIAEKGRDNEKRRVDVLSGEHLTTAYLSINPAGMVPALQCPDGHIITENSGIATYLEALWPDPPLLGTSALERGRVAQWNARIEFEGMLPLGSFLRNSHPAFVDRAIPGPGVFSQIAELSDRGRAQVAMFMPQLARQLGGGGHVAGEFFSMADITAIVFIDLALAVGLLCEGSFSEIDEWAVGVRARASYRAAG